MGSVCACVCECVCASSMLRKLSLPVASEQRRPPETVAGCSHARKNCRLCLWRRLNPNNIHYDAELAERYKHMNRCGTAP